MKAAQQIAFVICKYFNYSLLIIEKSTFTFYIVFKISHQHKQNFNFLNEVIKYQHQQHQPYQQHQYQLNIKQIFWNKS